MTYDFLPPLKDIYHTTHVKMKGNLYAITAVILYRFSFVLTNFHNTEEHLIDQLLISSFLPSCVIMESFGHSPIWDGRARIVCVETTSVLQLVHDNNNRRIPALAERKSNPCPQY